MAAAANDLARRHPPINAGATLSLMDRCYAIRDRLLGNPVFQRFSASFPLIRPIANAEARALFDLCAGFVYSQVLTACVRLDLFRTLASGPKTITELSRDCALPAEAMERLMLAAASLRLVANRGPRRFGLGVLGAALNGNPAIEAMVRHHAMLYRDLEDPLALLRGDRPETDLSKYWSYAGAAQPELLGADEVDGYSALMAASQSFIARDVFDAYPFDRHSCLLDIGGGEGAFIAAAAERFPKLSFQLFDLPAVAIRARARLADQLGSRLSVHAGSFVSDPLPGGADLVTLVRVVHDHDDASVMALLGEIHRALPPGGAVLVAEPMSGVRGADPVGDAYFGMYLLAMGQGRPRRPREIVEMLCDAGFSDVSIRTTRRPMLVGAVSGTRT